MDVTPQTVNSPLKSHVVSPTASPSNMFTMDMFTPYVEKGLDAWKKDHNVSDAEFNDPVLFRTDTRGKAMKMAVDDNNKMAAASKLSIDYTSPDARSERAARRSAVIQKIKDDELAESERSLKENRFTRPRRLPPKVIS